MGYSVILHGVFQIAECAKEGYLAYLGSSKLFELVVEFEGVDQKVELARDFQSVLEPLLISYWYMTYR